MQPLSFPQRRIAETQHRAIRVYIYFGTSASTCTTRVSRTILAAIETLKMNSEHNTMRKILCNAAAFILAASALAIPAAAQRGTAPTTPQQGAGRGNPLRQFIRTDAPVIALTHVKIFDGTGAAPTDDQTIVISGGKISWMGAAAQAQIPAGAQLMDLTGYTVMPGMVGMHEHMFYPAGGQYNELTATAPRLYLACGVTTARTAGSLDPYTDLNMKTMIDDGRAIGPKMNVTGPYL
jgi:hypothetical protein